MAVMTQEQITLSSVTDVKSTCRYYLLQSSDLPAPSKPTTTPPSSEWVTTEPSYTFGSTDKLYFVDLTVFSNNTFSYSDVSLSSSYEAAKTAYNKAVEAAKTATNYIDYSETGGLQVGNKQSGAWSGTRTQQTASAFNILGSAGEILASYGASVIEFGKNSISSIIKFCGGKGLASYSNQTKTFNLHSNENMDIHSLEKCEVYSRFSVMDSKPYPNTKTAYKKAGIDTYTGGDDMTGFDTNDCEVQLAASYKYKENETADYVETKSAVVVKPDSIDLQSDAVTVNGKKVGATVLWENEAPTANFAAQTLVVENLSKYSTILLEFKSTASGTYTYQQTFVQPLSTAKYRLVAFKSGGGIYYRAVSFDGDNIIFENGYNDSSAGAGNCIPTRIFGIM